MFGFGIVRLRNIVIHSLPRSYQIKLQTVSHLRNARPVAFIRIDFTDFGLEHMLRRRSLTIADPPWSHTGRLYTSIVPICRLDINDPESLLFEATMFDFLPTDDEEATIEADGGPMSEEDE